MSLTNVFRTLTFRAFANKSFKIRLQTALKHIPSNRQGGRKMKELLEVIATNLVDNPDDVVVTKTETDKNVVLELKVNQEDMGKVIGKQGRIAKAIRTVVKAASVSTDKKVQIDIMQQ